MLARSGMLLLGSLVALLAACQSAVRLDDDPGVGGGSTTGPSATNDVSSASTSSTSDPLACPGEAVPGLQVEGGAYPTAPAPGCDENPALIDVEGVVHFDDDGNLHVAPFDAGRDCVASDYTVGFDVPEVFASQVAPIPEGTFVHLIDDAYTLQGLSIINLPSHDGTPNPVADDAAPWLFITSGGGDTFTSPFPDLDMQTPFQCSDPHNADGNETFAFEVRSVAAGELAHVAAGHWETLVISNGPSKGTYAVANAGIGQNENVVSWHHASLFRLQP